MATITEINRNAQEHAAMLAKGWAQGSWESKNVRHAHTSVTFFHSHGGCTIVDGEDEARYAQLLADQGIGVTRIERALICDACRGLGVIETPYCRHRKAHPYHFDKCRKSCTQCNGQGQFPIGIEA